MPPFNGLSEFANSFYREVELAKQLVSPNPEDDLSIRMSIVGFSYNSPTSNWDLGHYQYIKTRLDRSYGSEELTSYGDNGVNVKLFFSLAVGYLLGLYQQGKLTDSEFNQAEQQIPGLIMYYLRQITDKAC